jgi:hypothetical protein
MPIPAGRYCQHCVDEHGKLQPFEERFERMVQRSLRKEPSLSRSEAEERVRAYLRTMPAWKGHPKLEA